MCTLPQKTGLYWARRDFDSDWLYVALIKGVKPFLTYSLWNTEYPDDEHNNYDRTNFKNLIFSDEIQFKPEKPVNLTVSPDIESSVLFDVRKDYVSVEKSGLYVIKTRTATLAYIKGDAPYFSCWLWDTKTDHKQKYLDPQTLLFVEYIEKPE